MSGMSRLEGKVAVITGTAGGIGRASALRFAEEGAAILGADVSAEANDDTARLVQDAGGKMVATTMPGSCCPATTMPRPPATR
jgi:NAD(P)-dependent dehydrogenase (short-subunit alcohol dehydrogenase family)